MCKFWKNQSHFFSTINRVSPAAALCERRFFVTFLKVASEIHLLKKSFLLIRNFYFISRILGKLRKNSCILPVVLLGKQGKVKRFCNRGKIKVKCYSNITAFTHDFSFSSYSNFWFTYGLFVRFEYIGFLINSEGIKVNQFT